MPRCRGASLYPRRVSLAVERRPNRPRLELLLDQHAPLAPIRTWEALAQLAETDGSTAAVRLVCIFIRRAVQALQSPLPPPTDRERRVAILGRFLSRLATLDEGRLAAVYRHVLALELGADLPSLRLELARQSNSAAGLWSDMQHHF